MNSYIIISIAILTGIFFAILMERLRAPSVAGYIIGGIILGQILSCFTKINVINELNIFSTIALSFIAFTVGGELKLGQMRYLGKSIFYIVIFETTLAFIFVTAITYLISGDFALSLILGSVSAATAPAATVMVIEQYHTQGPLTTTLLAVVGLDDAAALIIYSFAISISRVLLSPMAHPDLSITIFHPFIEIIGSFVSGILLGVLAGLYIRKRNTSKIENLAVPIGIILLITGIAQIFHFSSLLANMAFGFVLTNYAPNRSRRLFRSLREFAPPVYIVFFVLAGTRLDLKLLPALGILGIAYFLFRIIGKILGATIGAIIGKAPRTVRKYIGWGLISQVGIAIGLAVVIYNEMRLFGEHGIRLANITINILLATTIITEIIGPLMVKYAMKKANEIGKRTY